MKTNEIAKATRQSELARASALEAAGEHGDAAQVRAMVERDFPLGETMPRTAHDLLPGDTADQYNRKEISGSYRTPDGKAQIDFGITYRNGYPEYTSSGHFNGSSGQCLDAILAAYPDNVMVQDLHARWSKFHLQDVSKNPSVIDNTRRGAENFPAVSYYETQAQDFLSRNGLKFRATLSDSKTPAWANEGEETGHHYRVTISKDGGGFAPGSLLAVEFHSGVWLKTDRVRSVAGPFANHSEAEDRRVILERKPARLVFDFWGSVADARKLKAATARKKELEKSISLQEYQLSPIQNHGYARNELSSQNAANMREHLADLKARLASVEVELSGAHPSAYSVLACISGDAYTPETFADFCAEYGYESDSIKALQTYRRSSAFAKRLRAFFTADELTQLSQIQ